MNCMRTAGSINFRSIDGNSANFASAASSVNRISEEIYSQQAVYMIYTWSNLVPDQELVFKATYRLKPQCGRVFLARVVRQWVGFTQVAKLEKYY